MTLNQLTERYRPVTSINSQKRYIIFVTALPVETSLSKNI